MPKKPVLAEVAGAVVVSDLHCGSSVGLWPEGCEVSYGNIINLGNNLHQRWLWECWQDGTRKAIEHFGKDPFVLIVNGDCIEGRHHGTSEIVAAKNRDHCAAAIQALLPLASKAKASYFTAGTECHVGDWEEVIADEVGGKFAGDKLLLEINGTLLDVAHHMPATTRAYLEASMLGIVMGNARLNYSRSGHRVPRVFLRAHRHCGGHFSDMHGTILVTGAWQLLTRYGHKIVGDSLCRPSVGILDWRGLPKNSLPAVKTISYDPDQAKITRA
jgi:hypothetical protein